VDVLSLHGTNLPHPSQQSNNWSTNEASIAEELASHIKRVSTLDEIVSKRTDEIARLNREITECTAELELIKGQRLATSAESLERERALSNQVQEARQIHARQFELQLKHRDFEHTLQIQLGAAQERLEAALRALAEREAWFSDQLRDVHQAHLSQTAHERKDHAEREQTHHARLQTTEKELNAFARRAAETERIQALTISNLEEELKSIRATKSWRWSAPFRRATAILRTTRI
jgi:chromosome segregation ATPase